MPYPTVGYHVVERMEAITPLLKTLVSLVVIVNPLGAVPFYLTLTRDQPSRGKRRIALVAALATALILLIAAFAGNAVLGFFGISLPSFRVAGGVLLLLMGIDMMNARPSRTRQTPEEEEEATNRTEAAITPLALPLLAGPGAIGSVILLASRMADAPQMFMLAGIALMVGLLVWITLLLASPIGSALGKTGLNILTRIMGLIVVALAAEMIVEGVQAMWKQ